MESGGAAGGCAPLGVTWTLKDANNAVVPCSNPPWADAVNMAIYVNGAPAGRFSCTTGAPASISLPTGLVDVRIDALDTNNIIYYRDEKQFLVAACASQGTWASQPGQGWVNVNYTDTCHSPAPSYIWVKVMDDDASAIAADSSASPTTNVCGAASKVITFRLPKGNFTLQWTEEVISSAGSYPVVARNCSPTLFNPTNLGATTLFPVLSSSSTPCP